MEESTLIFNVGLFRPTCISGYRSLEMGVTTETAVLRTSVKMTDRGDLTTTSPQVKKTSHPTSAIVISLRVIWTVALIMFVIKHRPIQHFTNRLWGYLLQTWLFNSVYFETWLTTVSYGSTLFVLYLMEKIPFFDRYIIGPRAGRQVIKIWNIVLLPAAACVILMAVDALLLLEYPWAALQTVRALPTDPPPVFRMVWQLGATLVLADLVFRFMHIAFHKNRWLYKQFHRVQHAFATPQPRLFDFIGLKLFSTVMLRLLGNHPLICAIYLPLFFVLIFERFHGYDLPYSSDKVVPFRLLTGTAHIYGYHVDGSHFYQLLFTYIDGNPLYLWSRNIKRRLN